VFAAIIGKVEVLTKMKWKTKGRTLWLAFCLIVFAGWEYHYFESRVRRAVLEIGDCCSKPGIAAINCVRINEDESVAEILRLSIPARKPTAENLLSRVALRLGINPYSQAMFRPDRAVEHLTDAGKRKILPELLRALDENAPYSEEYSSYGLMSAITGTGESAIPELIELLKHKDEEVRYRAAQFLGVYGTSAKAAVPDLLLVLNDGSMAMFAAAQAIGEIADDAETVSSLHRLSQQNFSDMRAGCITNSIQKIESRIRP
jgi:hypothetical protein